MSKFSGVKRGTGLALLQMKNTATLLGKVRQTLKAVSKQRLREALADETSMQALGEELTAKLEASTGQSIPQQTFLEALKHQRKKALKSQARQRKYLGKPGASPVNAEVDSESTTPADSQAA